MTGKRHEYIGILLLLITVLLFVCLISYSSLDPSHNVLSYKIKPDNQAGKLGAYVSDYLFQALGFSAFLLLFPLAIISWKLIRGREIYSPYVRGLGIFLLICATSTGLHLLPIQLAHVNFP